jgi:hypothetical protein
MNEVNGSEAEPVKQNLRLSFSKGVTVTCEISCVIERKMWLSVKS